MKVPATAAVTALLTMLASLVGLSAPAVADDAGNGGVDDTVVAQPAADLQVEVTSRYRRVKTTWDPVAGADAYRVLRKECRKPVSGQVCDPFTKIATLNPGRTQYTFKGKVSRRYRVVVVAVRRGQDNVRSTSGTAVTVPQLPRGTASAEYGSLLGLYENVTLTNASPYAENVWIFRQTDGGESVALGKATNFGKRRWILNRGEGNRRWDAPDGGHDYTYTAMACNDAGCSARKPGDSQRVPYWYAVDGDDPLVHLRFSQDTYGNLEDLSFARGDGTEDDILFLQDPAFRSAEGTDKAFYLTGRARDAGVVVRSGGLDPNPSTGSRSVEFFFKTGGHEPGGALVGHQGETPASGFVITSGATPDQLTFNGTPVDVAVHDGAWHHLVVTYDAEAGTVVFYLDGEVADTLAEQQVSTVPTANLFVAWVDGAFGGQQGTYDEFSLFERALTETEVGEHWAARADGD